MTWTGRTWAAPWGCHDMSAIIACVSRVTRQASPVGVHLQVHPVQLHGQVDGELVGAGVGSVVQDTLHWGPGVGSYIILYLKEYSVCTLFEMSFPFCVSPQSQGELSILDGLFLAASISYFKISNAEISSLRI